MITITPLEHSAGFGAFVSGVDLNNLDDATFKTIEEALYVHKLLVIKDQKHLTPVKQYEFNRRFDPKASGQHGHGTHKDQSKQFKGKKNITGGLPGVPECEDVRIVGKGTVGPGHYGTTEDTVMNGASHATWHKFPLTNEEIEAGETRFQRWHIDVSRLGKTLSLLARHGLIIRLFPKNNHTAKVTTLWAHTLPKGPNINLRFDDGSGHCMSVPPGRTAFIDTAKMYEALKDEDKQWVEHSLVEYAPSPYEWIINAKGTSNGYDIFSDDKEVPIEDLPNGDESQCQILPLLWQNPVTGEKALQVHAIVARKLHVKTSPDGPVRIVDDVREVRRMIRELQAPFFQPENIIFSPQEDGGERS
ncbi:hypothetical protein MNV49_002105 [Pseudohyphozyma bogoriensis]|nr:hypothetical protein MNV49_002105 [Pseudohyphozyma bogoriensis]